MCNFCYMRNLHALLFSAIFETKQQKAYNKMNVKGIITAGIIALVGASTEAANVVYVIHLNWLADDKDLYHNGQKSGTTPIATFDGEHLFIYIDVAVATATIVDEAGAVVYEGAGVNEGGCFVLVAQQLPKVGYALYVETEKGTYGGEFRVE